MLVLNKLCYGSLDVPWPVLRNALLGCFRGKPAAMIPYLNSATGFQRELLARVLSEVANATVEGDLSLLVEDISDEIRASAARALGTVKSGSVLPPLARLVTDPVWFVRLRAVVALAELSTSAAVPLLIRALTDPHQLVRQRAAWGLLKFPQLTATIIRQVVDLRDRYGLQAFVSELERTAMYETALTAIRLDERAEAPRLLGALAAARDALQLHSQRASAMAGD